jgi:cation diffusion facilitator family transporter
MAMHKAEKLTLLGVFLNFILFVLKFTIGFLSNSLALMSDAFNSLGDIVSYTGIYFAVRIAHKRADDDHPFGHKRAEPIAGFVIALFTFLLAIEIMKNAVTGFFQPRVYAYEGYAIGVLLFTMVVKSGMAFFYSRAGKEHNSPALRAGATDSKNDVLVSGIALIGVVGPWIGFPLLDSIAALIISLYIFYSGYRIGKENVDYLMGKSPPQEEIEKIKALVMKVGGVKGINDVRAHYIGHHIHIEIHIEVDKHMTTENSHGIGKEVQHAVENHGYVDKAFIHIDPR